MLGKLFKYEWRSISKLLLPIHGFVLLFALLSRFYFTISGGTDALLNTDSTIIGTLTMLLIFALVIVISSIAIFTYIYIYIAAIISIKMYLPTRATLQIPCL